MKKYLISDIVPNYQPIIQIATGEVVMYECLARFLSLDGRPLFPADMLKHFDDPEFLWELFERTFIAIMAHAKKEIIIAINVDICSLTERFFYFIENLFHKYPNIAQYIHFEVTERNLGKGMLQLKEYTQSIQKLGAQVVLDDFGTGGANIECLEMIQFDHVKIDGQFFKAAVVSPAGYRRLKLIVDLLKSYNVPIVGEHIENAKIEEIAKALQIDYGQGYYYGMPAPLIHLEPKQHYLSKASGQ